MECAAIGCDAPEATTRLNIRLFVRFLVLLVMFSALYLFGREFTTGHHRAVGTGTVLDALWAEPLGPVVGGTPTVYHGANAPIPASIKHQGAMMNSAKGGRK
jgi:hypothetical protein